MGVSLHSKTHCSLSVLSSCVFPVCIPHTANGWFMVIVISRCNYALYKCSCACTSTYHLMWPSQPWHVCKDPSHFFSTHMGHIIMSSNKWHWAPLLLPILCLLVIKSNWPRNQHTCINWVWLPPLKPANYPVFTHYFLSSEKFTSQGGDREDVPSQKTQVVPGTLLINVSD